MKTDRYITMFREAHSLNWDFYVSFSQEEVSTVIKNLKSSGVVQYNTAPLGENIAELSCEF